MYDIDEKIVVDKNPDLHSRIPHILHEESILCGYNSVHGFLTLKTVRAFTDYTIPKKIEVCKDCILMLEMMRIHK